MTNPKSDGRNDFEKAMEDLDEDELEEYFRIVREVIRSVMTKKEGESE